MLELAPYSWQPIDKVSYQLSDINPLFERIDVKQIEIELEKLRLNSL